MSEKRRNLAIDKERQRIFLEALAEHGSFFHAAAKASPHADPEHGAVSSFRMLRERDPEFAAAVEEARNKFLGKAEHAIAERSFTPGVRESYDEHGRLRSRELSWRDANVMLLRTVGRHDPSWREGRNVQVSGAIEHTTGNPRAYQISADDILALEPEDRRAMIELLGKVESSRLAAEQGKGNGQREIIEQPESTLTLPSAEGRDGDGQ